MPKIADKRKVLGGRGCVVLYASGTSAGQFFYRELIKGTKSYMTRRIEGVSNMDEAEAAATEVAFELNKKPDLSLLWDKPKGNGSEAPKRDYFSGRVVSRKPRSIPVSQAVQNWLRLEYEKADSGLIRRDTVDKKAGLCRRHLIPYLESKGVTRTAQIDATTFEGYPIYRSASTPLGRRQELGTIQEWCRNYLVKNRYLDSSLLLDKQTPLIPRTVIRQTDLMKNPAINPEDWKIIVNYVRDVWKKESLTSHPKAAGWFYRNMFHHFILFAKNSGMSPEEVMKMKWKQIEIVDEGRINSKGEKVSWEVAYIRTIRSKTQQAREIPVNQARELRRWKQWLDEYIIERDLRNVQVKKDSLVFGNPHYNWRAFSYKYIAKSWVEIRNKLKDQLIGHRFSPHPYTIYSMRSTFIEDQLMKGTPVMEVAEMAGHDVRETQRTYARLNLRRKGTELTLPEIGKKRLESKLVNLFADDWG